MKLYKGVRSEVCPEAIVFDGKNIWENFDVKEKKFELCGAIYTEYEFNQRRYSKDEYIALLSEKNQELEAQVTDTQLALCEIYEGMM